MSLQTHMWQCSYLQAWDHAERRVCNKIWRGALNNVLSAVPYDSSLIQREETSRVRTCEKSATTRWFTGLYSVFIWLVDFWVLGANFILLVFNSDALCLTCVLFLLTYYFFEGCQAELTLAKATRLAKMPPERNRSSSASLRLLLAASAIDVAGCCCVPMCC